MKGRTDFTAKRRKAIRTGGGVEALGDTILENIYYFIIVTTISIWFPAHVALPKHVQWYLRFFRLQRRDHVFYSKFMKFYVPSISFIPRKYKQAHKK